MADQWVSIADRDELDRLAAEQVEKFRLKAEALARLCENEDFKLLAASAQVHIDAFVEDLQSPAFPDARRQFVIGMLWGLRYLLEHPKNVAKKLADDLKMKASQEKATERQRDTTAGDTLSDAARGGPYS